MKVNLIVAACQGRGIGIKGNLPWRLKNEMAYFTRMTSTVVEEGKWNVVIMGRKTWQSIPPKYRPLSKRLNIILSTTISEVECKDVLVCPSLDKAMELLGEPWHQQRVESIWIIGGHSVYQAALNSDWCDRIYYTDVRVRFECDTFFPIIPSDFVQVSDDRVPEGIHKENGIEYEYQVFQRATLV